jgi:hypothetical protein
MVIGVLIGVGIFCAAVLGVCGWIVWDMHRSGKKAQAEHDAWLREWQAESAATRARLDRLTGKSP